MPKAYTFATGTNANYLEALYEDYKKNPSSLESSWQKFFEGYEFALSSFSSKGSSGSKEDLHDSAKIEALINAFRRLGHLSAHLNPLSEKPPIAENMQPAFHGIKNISSNKKFRPANFGNIEMGFDEILQKLHKTYCGTIGADFREMNDIQAVTWLQEKMEGCNNKPELTKEDKTTLLHHLIHADGFEKFLQTRYLGQKRFSLEGLDALIPLLHTIIEEKSTHGVEEICIGMAHRGRLNVLCNVLGKPYIKMLNEFEGAEFNAYAIDGDVKYHLGFGSEKTTKSGKPIRLYLSPNPSHLEAVNPLVEGFAYSRQLTLKNKNKVAPILLHGDASFIGQGIVAETLNLSKLKDYETGGTIHIITNNQIGFTTNPEDSRSCTYSSDICKMIRAPVFHVNADDPEAVFWVGKLAVMFRMKFKQDVVIDLIGYRRHGHNETDEPSFTQPLMYNKINSHTSVASQYGDKLQREGVVSAEYIQESSKKLKDQLEDAYLQVHNKKVELPKFLVPKAFEQIFQYKKVERKEIFSNPKTQIKKDVLKEIANEITSVPQGFSVHPKLDKLLKSRKEMLEDQNKVDWSFGELLAFSSLAKEGYSIRLSGQDCKRGTFSSRHGVVFDYKNGVPHELLQKPTWGNVSIINSPLSEQGCLGFEFGYSIASPNTLVLWEAQFGDFVNGAQIIIDQFLVASEAKWKQTSGLVLLLPHGYEGMGPEHSSARPERFLQCCGNLNIQVCNVTSPAQYFHLLRRQMLRDFRKPLILMTPKSLLRHPKVSSGVKDFTDNTFQEILEDLSRNEKSEKILLCSGKIYFELQAKVEEMKKSQDEFPIIRVEQLYPFPKESLEKVFKQYKKLTKIIWVQEEPKNMGYWTFVSQKIQEILPPKVELTYIGRNFSGTTAEGSSKAHALEQQRILAEAFV